MNHGFAGARGNFSDPWIRERVDEVIATLGAFFDRNLRAADTTTTTITTTATTSTSTTITTTTYLELFPAEKF